MFRNWLRGFVTGSDRGTAGRRPSSRRRSTCPRVEGLEERTLLAAHLVADLNTTTTAGSYPLNFTSLNGATLFFADDGIHGRELWKTDGTAQGTVLVKDVWAGSGAGVASGAAGSGSPVTPLVIANGTAFFVANDGIHGNELWKTDGSTDGTRLVKDLNPGPEGAFNSAAGETLVAVKGTVFFLANDGTGTKLYESDGSDTGTVPVKDRNGDTFSSVSGLAAVGGKLVFAGSTSGSSAQTGLWTTDGTPGGTSRIATAVSAISDTTDVAGTAYFVVSAGSGGTDTQLWKGDAPSTGMLKDFGTVPGGAGPAVFDLTNVNGTLYFAAGRGSELWTSNGTPAVNKTVYFEGNGPAGPGLWKTDGTSVGTGFVKAVTVSSLGVPSAADVNGTLYFAGDDGGHGSELWTSNGTTAGTQMVLDINTQTSSDPTSITNVNGEAFFVADDGIHGTELWKSDGTTAGTQLVKDLLPGKGGGVTDVPVFGPSGIPAGRSADLTNVNGTLYFFATDGNPADGTLQLWKSGGTAGSTVLVKGFNPAKGNLGRSGEITSVNGTIYFVVDDGISGRELWKTDGTTAGTRLVRDINLGSAGSDPLALTAVGDTLYFFATDLGGTKLWKSDGSAKGTVPVQAMAGTSMINVGGTLYFTAADAVHGVQLWTSNGTTQGTRLLGSAGPGTTLSNPLVSVNARLYFGVATPGPGAPATQLWTSDRTAGGTVALTTVAALGNLTALNGTLFFSADDGKHGSQLWTSNGTPRGTSLLKTINPNGSADPSDFAAIGNILFFAADDGSHGRELWCSDGTAPGTFLYQDIVPAPRFGSSPHGLANVNGKLFFAANDGVHGDELWSDLFNTGQAATTTGLTAVPASVGAGQPVTLTATVRPSQGAVDGGSVTFLEGQSELGTVAVDGNGVATLSLVLGGGPHSITALYSGDVNFAASPSQPAGLTVTASTAIHTSTGLVASAASVAEGQPVTFTATVTPDRGTLDGGSVDFTDGGTDLGSVSVPTDGVVTLTKVLGVGSHRITASYSGDPTFAGSASNPVDVTVDAAAQVGTATGLVASASSVAEGQPVTFTATVTPDRGRLDGGTVDFTDGAADLGSVSVPSDGVVTLTKVLGAGAHHVVATYSGDPNFARSVSSSVPVMVVAGTVTSLVPSATSVGAGQPVTFTATVTPDHGTLDGGTVDFTDGAMNLGAFPVTSGGVATLTLVLAVGTHDVTATYAGAAGFGPSVSSPVSVTVTQSSGAVPTSTSLTASAENVHEGQSVTFTATVTPDQGTLDGGTVDFTDGSTDLGQAAVSDGVATLTRILDAGVHSVSAAYLGDAAFAGSASSSPVPVTVEADTTTTLAASATTVLEGESVTFTAMVTPDQGTLDGGTVDFRDGSTDLGQAAVSDGVATLTETLAVGAHGVTATYLGDPNFAASPTSAPASVTVRGRTGTLLIASASTVPAGEPVTFTATVTHDQGTLDGGSVEFTDGTTDLGSVSVPADGVVTLTTTLPAGPHQVIATYSGDPTFAGSVSPGVPVAVMPHDTAIGLTASATNQLAGQPVTFTAAVHFDDGVGPAPAGGGSVLFEDQGAPIAMIPLNPSTGTATLTTVLAPGPHHVTAIYLGDASFSGSTSPGVDVLVLPPPPPATGDVSAFVDMTLSPVPTGRGGRSRALTQVLTIVNSSEQVLQGPLLLVVRGLRNGVRLRGIAGFVGRGRRRSPFVVVTPAAGMLQPDGSITVTLQFSGRPNGFTVAVLAGTAPG
jgi:ELWxxDGT repeat protein